MKPIVDIPGARAPSVRRWLRAVVTAMAVLVPFALLALFIVGPRVMRCFCTTKVDIAKATLKKYVDEAYPQWREDHSRAVCPADIAALNEYMNDQRGRDPWDRLYDMTCDEHANLCCASARSDATACRTPTTTSAPGTDPENDAAPSPSSEGAARDRRVSGRGDHLVQVTS